MVSAVLGSSFLGRSLQGTFDVVFQLQLRPLPRFPYFRLLPLVPLQGQAFSLFFAFPLILGAAANGTCPNFAIVLTY